MSENAVQQTWIQTIPMAGNLLQTTAEHDAKDMQPFQNDAETYARCH